MPPRCVVYRLGLVDYTWAWELQDRLARRIAAGEHPPALLLLEHPHVYTFGRRGQAENLVWGEAERARRGVQVVWSDRGGDVTYHGPGQVVGYPLLPLAPGGLAAGSNADGTPRLPQADYVGYLRRLEQTLILALLRLGVAAGQINGLTGVWVQGDVRSRCLACDPAVRQPPAKIAAIGVKVDARGVSRHGFALNVDPDMEYWQGIVGCGLKDYPVTSLAELLSPAPDLPQIMDQIMRAFGEVFNYEMVEKQWDGPAEG